MIRSICLVCIIIVIVSCGNEEYSTDLLLAKNIESQYFKINIWEDTIIKTEKGTIIQIPSNIFQVSDKNNQVEIEVKEVLDKVDILKNGLRTISSDKELLESGGMIYFGVQPMQELKKGKKFQIKLPTEGVNSKMRLFRLVNSDQVKNGWKLADTLKTTKEAQIIERGRDLYENNCRSCHSMDLRKDLTGPALGNVHLFRQEDWLVSFTKNSQEMILKGDSLAQFISNYWSRLPMVSFAKVLTTEEIKNIYLFLKNESGLQSIDTNEVKYILDSKVEVIGDPDDPNYEDVIRYENVYITNQDTDRIILTPNFRTRSLVDILVQNMLLNEEASPQIFC